MQDLQNSVQIANSVVQPADCLQRTSAHLVSRLFRADNCRHLPLMPDNALLFGQLSGKPDDPFMLDQRQIVECGVFEGG